MILLFYAPFCRAQQLSQNYNHSIAEINSRIFIASLDGLNVYNGDKTFSYKEFSHDMKGNVLQGVFYKDERNHLWFTTYNGLHVYDDIADSIKSFELTEVEGNLVKSDYKLIRSCSENEVLMKLSNEFVQFNCLSRSIVDRWPINFQKYGHLDLIAKEDTIFAIGGSDKHLELRIYVGHKLVEKRLVDLPVSQLIFQDDYFWIGTLDGQLYKLFPKYNWNIASLELNIESVFSLTSNGTHGLWIGGSDELAFLNTNIHKVTRVDLDQPVSNILSVYLAYDSTLWIGRAGIGVSTYNLGDLKIDLWKGADNMNISVSQMIETKFGFLVGCRKCGLLHFNKNGYFNSSTALPYNGGYQEIPFVVQERNSDIYANDWSNLYYLSNQKLYLVEGINEPVLYFTQDNFGDLYGLGEYDYFLKIKVNKGVASTKKVLQAPKELTKSMYVYGFFDKENRFVVSNNDENILVFDSDHETCLGAIGIKGGLSSMLDIDSHVLITNYNGLFKINKKDFSYEQILDDKSKLAQQIYGLLIDDNGFYWMSTNNGLYRYDPNTNHAHQFKMKDGLQALEYNTMSFLEDSKGRFLFGGVNGINVFDPLKVKLSDKQAPVDFYNYKINDADSREFGVANYVDQFDLYHDNNTITFEFVGIDYSGPEHVNLKYFMEGYDNDWVELEENDGVARYANLPYGDYTFSMLASNSDEVWADTPKTVSVSVHPPFWATWWFKTFAGVLLLWSGYSIVRSYYRRKLERRDFVLKQQALLIEKQEAVEYERNRIASEMHDDLGSGLTTIKYLSEHAMKSSVDEKEKNKIARIADHANTLVSNMSEIIWAMNSRYDTATDLVGYIRRYASEYLEEHHKTLSFSSEGISHKLEISGEKRRNLFLVTKEILHNFIKYAEVEEMKIDISMNEKELRLEFLELESAGFDVGEAAEKGNGLFNMNKRMDQIGGKIEQGRVEDGFRTVLKWVE